MLVLFFFYKLEIYYKKFEKFPEFDWKIYKSEEKILAKKKYRIFEEN